jgi:hypothetical protein
MAVSPLVHAIVPEVEETPKPWSRRATSPVPIPVSIEVPLPQIVAQDAEGNHKNYGRHIADHQPLTVSRATRPCHRCGSVSSRPLPEPGQQVDHLTPDLCTAPEHRLAQ